MERRSVLCYAGGHADQYEAVCVDFDIWVHGKSLDEVKATLHDAIRSYIQDACKEDPATAIRLLKRRTPWHVQMKLKVGYFLHTLFHRPGDQQIRAGFDIPCPA